MGKRRGDQPFFFSHTLTGSVLNGFLQFLASKAFNATRDRTKSPATIAMFLSVTNFIAGLQTQDWFQMHNHPGAIAADACGVKYKTYEKHILSRNEQQGQVAQVGKCTAVPR